MLTASRSAHRWLDILNFHLGKIFFKIHTLQSNFSLTQFMRPNLMNLSKVAKLYVPSIQILIFSAAVLFTFTFIGHEQILNLRIKICGLTVSNSLNPVSGFLKF